MSNYSTHPRILFVTPEAAFIPEGTENRPNYTSAHTGGFGDFLAGLMQPGSGKICFMKDIPAVTSKHATPILNMNILLIDDDEWIRDSLRIFFETEGCHVVVLETAEEGLAELKYQAYDLIIVDYKLPGLDGLEFLKRTHDEHSDAMKVLITAYRTNSVVSEARKAKLQGFI